MRASRDRAIVRHNERAWHTWHTAAIGRAKKVPRLSKFQIKIKKAQSIDDQKNAALAWTKLLGGKVR